MTCEDEQAIRIATNVDEFECDLANVAGNEEAPGKAAEVQYRLPVWDVQSLVEGAVAWNVAFAKVARGDFSGLQVDGCSFQDDQHERLFKLTLMTENLHQDYCDICHDLGYDFGVAFLSIIHGSKLIQDYMAQNCSVESVGSSMWQQIAQKAESLRELLDRLGDLVSTASRERDRLTEQYKCDKARMELDLNAEKIKQDILKQHDKEIASMRRAHNDRIRKLKARAHARLAVAGKSLSQFVQAGDANKIDTFSDDSFFDEKPDDDEYILPASLTGKKYYTEKPSLYILINRARTKIKIGVSTSVESRKSDLECANGEILDILAVVPPESAHTLKLESELHGKFSEYRLRGEWFTPAQPIYDYVASLPPRFRAVRRRDASDSAPEILDDDEAEETLWRLKNTQYDCGGNDQRQYVACVAPRRRATPLRSTQRMTR